MSGYQEHATVPAYVQALWVDGKLVNEDAGLLWGGAVVPPAVGTAIIVTMNGLGAAVVTGYFTQDGWLGLLCKLENPPEWHKKQNKNDPTGHIFGVEFKLP